MVTTLIVFTVEWVSLGKENFSEFCISSGIYESFIHENPHTDSPQTPTCCHDTLSTSHGATKLLILCD